MAAILVAALPACPRCGGGGMTADWFDDDETCIICGHVRYSSKPIVSRATPIFNYGRVRRSREPPLIDGTVARARRRRL